MIDLGDLNYIRSARQQEIEQGLNAYTYPPIYIVFETIFSICEANSDYSQSTSLFGHREEFVRYSSEADHFISPENNGDWSSPIEVNGVAYGKVVKKCYHDRFVTVCFTREAAQAYIQRDKHNLTNPRIYVQGINSKNIQLTAIGELFGDRLIGNKR